MIQIFNPYNGKHIGDLREYTKEELDSALRDAKAAQKNWAKRSKHDRADILFRWAELLRRHADELSALVMNEVGKTLGDAKKEVLRSAEYIEFTNQEFLHQDFEAMPGDNYSKDYRDKVAMVQRRPLGLVLAVSPFNYPVNLSISKISPALVTGNAVIFKPATQGALSGMRIAELLYEAGLDLRIMPVITGKGSEIGDFLTTHPLIDMISFTGSTSVGNHIADLVGGVPLVLEMGGKDAALVLDQAKMEVAADEIIKGGFGYSSQRCTAIKRVIVLEELYDELCARLTEGTKSLSVGSPEDDCVIVPLISKKSADYVEELILDAKNKGAVVLCGGGRTENLVQPTILTGVTKDMRIYYEEPFGPVFPIMAVKNIREAIDMANDSPYGLQCSIFMEDIDMALAIANEIDVGSAQINGRTERGPDNLPFLGVKNSGFGVQGVRSSIESMTRIKVNVLNLTAQID